MRRPFENDDTAADIFFDCKSRFSLDTSTASINRLSTNFTGSPAYIFERHESSHPQLYAMEALFSNPLFVLAMKQTYKQDQLTHHYYLFYAQAPRCWQRVIVSVTFRNFLDVSAIPQVSSPDTDEFTCMILPDAVSSILHTELPRIELFSSVTRMSLYLDEGGAGKKIWKVPHIKSFEDRLEIEMSKEDEILRDVEVMALNHFSESEIDVMSQISSSRFVVKLDDQVCVNRKMPFASAGWDSENGLHDFIKDLKLLNSLQGCHGVPRLIGVVFDDAHVRLKGYLYEAPMIRELIRTFYVANSRSETIPWSIRVLWAKQMAQGMAEIHRRGFTIGVLGRNNIGLRADGSPVLTHLTTSRMNMHHNKESIPPELQNSHGIAPQVAFNDRTDVFQFGLLLWLLAEHKGNTDGVRCSRYVCTNIPRYQCTADHANLANLPPCLGSVPSCFSDIIIHCRSPNPSARPTARMIVEILSSQCEFEDFSRDSLELLKTYNDNVRFGAHCMECGVPALHRHYHCYACDFGDFDLCPDCVDIGVHCRVLEHQMVERTSKDGGFIHAS